MPKNSQVHAQQLSYRARQTKEYNLERSARDDPKLASRSLETASRLYADRLRINRGDTETQTRRICPDCPKLLRQFLTGRGHRNR